jgi:hypothetical protein
LTALPVGFALVGLLGIGALVLVDFLLSFTGTSTMEADATAFADDGQPLTVSGIASALA